VQKLALITGTGSGIGKALAELLLDKNYKVIGYSRTNQIIHTNFSFIKIDLSNLAATEKLVFPKANESNVLLVNNAATIGTIIPFNKKTTKDIINEYQLNLISPTLLCNKFINTYKKNSKLLINIGSGAANNPIPSWSTYCSAKAGLDMFTQVVVKENHKNLTVFSISPGIVNTNMQKKIREADPDLFPLLSKFISYYNNNELENTETVAKKLYYIIQHFTKFTKNSLSIRDVNIK
jgi:benzil reductase ((S)-benzoin forming)